MNQMLILHLLQEGPANTTGYMIAGYVVIFGVIFIYLASLVLRNRNLKQDLDILRDLEQQEDQRDGAVSRQKVAGR